MKYGEQVQIALDRLDNSLKKLHTMVKRGENANAIQFMEQGELKDRYEELQNIVTVAGGPGNLGASGTVNTGMFRS
tara:strand:+ start:252 stop:479 length:228 start_codon:yes stop_codon:yes gene_type:complete